MKVVYQTCCGVDVHKSFLVATIIKTTSGVEPSYQKKRFSTFNNSILQFKEWLVKNQCRDVASFRPCFINNIHVDCIGVICTFLEK